MNAVTNFDISRYDVERIMASNTLLAGEMARRNSKDINEPRTEATIGYNVVTSQIINREEAIEGLNNNENGSSEWKMALYQQSNSCDQKTINCGNYRNSAFSGALHDLIGIESVGSSQTMLHDSTKIGTHFSNPSSLVTSLSSSREGSPDKIGPTFLFPKHPLVVPKIVSPIANGGLSSWFPPAAGQIRPTPAALSMSHMPVFAAWSDP